VYVTRCYTRYHEVRVGFASVEKVAGAKTEIAFVSSIAKDFRLTAHIMVKDSHRFWFHSDSVERLVSLSIGRTTSKVDHNIHSYKFCF
jgi:hypothetical protein